MKELYQAALEFVMNFYNVSCQDAIDFYKDEIKSAMNLIEKGVIPRE